MIGPSTLYWNLMGWLSTFIPRMQCIATICYRENHYWRRRQTNSQEETNVDAW